jgi:hypothetical protein
MPGNGKHQNTSNRDGTGEGKRKTEYHCVYNMPHTANPSTEMAYKYTQL